MTTTRLEVDDRGVATVTLTRPDKRNALNADLQAELISHAAKLGGDTAVRVVVLRGEGPCFCAGGDLDWMRQQFEASRPERITAARMLARMLRDLNELPKPLIAAVHGAALGGGAGLVAVCDNAIADERATFGFTETRLGLSPATIGPYVAAKLGQGAARRVFMSSRIFGAEEALRLGLIGKVVRAEDLDAAIAADVKPYLSAAPGAVSAAKGLLRRLTTKIDDALIEDTITHLADMWERDEAHEGVRAFFERRAPSWAVTDESA